MKIFAIALNTFREAIRDKILYSILFFALLMIGATFFLGQLSIGDFSKVVKDLGLASISIFGTVISIFVGIGLVYKEIERRTIYTILSKPIHRYQFLLGKFSGLALTLLVEVVIMTVAFTAIVLAVDGTITPMLYVAIGFIFQELLLITAFAVLFSSYSSPMLAGLFTSSIFVIGHLTADLRSFGRQSDNPALQQVMDVLYYVLPNLENFNYKAQVVHQVAIPTEQLLFSLMYGIIYGGVVLALAALIFERRDFK